MPINVQDGGITVKPLRGSEIAMHNLGNKLARGQELNTNEFFQAVSLASQNIREKFGPVPANMEVNPPDLPESTKGVLANYAS